MKKMLFIVLTIVLTLGLVGGVAFAQETESISFMNDYGQYCYEDQEILQTLRENGFEEMATLMENRDRDGMREIMRKMSDEDFTRIHDIMNEEGYRQRNIKSMANRMMGNRGFGIGRRCR